MVTQQELAEKLGLDQTTVSKILIGRERHLFRKETIKKVLTGARKYGYPVWRIRQLRRSKRRNLNTHVNIQIIRDSDKGLHAQGRARLLNLSAEGALLSDFELRPANAFPTERFHIVIETPARPEEQSAGRRLLCLPVRFANERRELSIAVILEMPVPTAEDGLPQ